MHKATSIACQYHKVELTIRVYTIHTSKHHRRISLMVQKPKFGILATTATCLAKDSIIDTWGKLHPACYLSSNHVVVLFSLTCTRFSRWIIHQLGVPRNQFFILAAWLVSTDTFQLALRLPNKISMPCVYWHIAWGSDWVTIMLFSWLLKLASGASWQVETD